MDIRHRPITSDCSAADVKDGCETMWEKIRVIWQIPELRTKILSDAADAGHLSRRLSDSAADHRPGGSANASAARAAASATCCETVAMLSASQLQDVTIFGLGIMPYISASIIFQLLASVYPPLEQLQKEGEAGRKKINEYTRYATVFLVFVPKLVLRRVVRRAAGLRAARVSRMRPARCIWQLEDHLRADDDRRHRCS